MMRRSTFRLAAIGLVSLASVVAGLSALPSLPTANARPDPGLRASSRATPTLRVIFVDVGQGDAIILRSGSWTGLIDGGPSGSAARISAQLRKSGATRIDCLVLSHLHADHIGGLLGVVERYKPRKVLLAGSSTTATWRNLKSTLTRVGAQLLQVRGGKSLRCGKAKAKVLSPGGVSGEPNEDSVVVLVTAASKRFLFTGDVTGPNEETVGAACARGPPLYLLKVAHHGSQYSTTASFLEQTRPRRAVICVGANSYGHPTPETISRLKASATRTYSTKRNGNITVTVAASGKVSWSFSRSSRPIVGKPTPTVSPTPSVTPTQPGDPIVYITETGECYHRDGCRYLANSKIPIKLSEAKAQGYRPCSVCDPPL